MSNIRTNTNVNNFNLKTISSLPVLSNDITAQSLFEVSFCTTDNTYSSRCITFDKLKENIKNYTIDVLKKDYGLTNDINLSDMLNKINSYWNNTKEVDETCVAQGVHIFNNSPYIKVDIEVTDNMDWLKHKNRVAKIGTLIDFNKDANSIYLNKGGGFATRYYSIDTQTSKDEVGLSAAPSSTLSRHNAYIFRIIGTESKEWICPKSGWFTCYGWVDEANTDNAACTRWITLEGYFGNNDDDINEDDNWKVLQFQPVIESTTCSYVSFGIPVKSGLKLRLKSGFKVGTNSGLYWNFRNSMTNHIPNAFIGGIYNGYSFE